jgi:CheY-like chemotaxis protein
MDNLPIQIWLVEDNEGDIRLMQEALDEQAFRYELRVFYDGDQALQDIDTAGETEHPCPDLLLLDLHLPKVDGAEVLRRFRANTNCVSTPVVILSSSIAPIEHAYIHRFSGVTVQEKAIDLDGCLAVGRHIKQILLLSADAN